MNLVYCPLYFCLLSCIFSHAHTTYSQSWGIQETIHLLFYYASLYSGKCKWTNNKNGVLIRFCIDFSMFTISGIMCVSWPNEKKYTAFQTISFQQLVGTTLYINCFYQLLVVLYSQKGLFNWICSLYETHLCTTFLKFNATL